MNDLEIVIPGLDVDKQEPEKKDADEQEYFL